jgi:transposase-like protein
MKFNEELRLELLNNSNVVKCSNKAITYSKDFKVNAVKLYYEEGLSPSQIFIDAGFDVKVIGTDTPHDRLRDWRKTYNRQGEGGLLSKKRGNGRPKTKDITPEYRIKRLEAEVAYLKAENDFLAKLRAKRRTE